MAVTPSRRAALMRCTDVIGGLPVNLRGRGPGGPPLGCRWVPPQLWVPAGALRRNRPPQAQDPQRSATKTSVTDGRL